MFRTSRVIQILMFGISGFVAIVVSAWVFQSQHSSMIHNENLLMSSLETWSEAVALSLSAFDYNTANQLVSFLEDHPEVRGLELIDRNGFLVASLPLHSQSVDQNLKEVAIELFPQAGGVNGTEPIGLAKFTIASNNLSSFVIASIINGIIAGIVVGVATAVVLSTYISQFVTKPLNHFFEAVEETSRTGEHARVAYLSESRLGRLARGFNMMQEQLERESRAQQTLIQKNSEMNQRLAKMLDDLTKKQKEQEWQLEAVGRILKRSEITLTYVQPDGVVAFTSETDHPIPVINQIIQNAIFDIDLICEKLIAENLSVDVIEGSRGSNDGAFTIEVGREDGNVWQMLASAQDREGRIMICVNVSNQRRLERELRHQQKMDAVDRLTGGIAHEVNNMLAIAYGGLQLLDGQQSQSNAKIINSSIRAIDRASTTIGQLLTYSRKKVHITKEIDLQMHMDGLLQMLDRVVGPRISLKAEIEPGIILTVDPDGLDGAIVNLATNARDAIKEGGSIRIVARKRVLPSTNENVCRIEFSDDGEGIARLDIDKVFEPFFSTKSASNKGIGLGLSVVRGFIEAAGGKVAVQSQLGRGTTFLIDLPMTSSQDDIVKAEQDSTRVLGGLCLVVDDELDLLEINAKMIEILGYEVKTATSVASAIEVLSKHEPDKIGFLVSDIQLTDGSGAEIADVFLSTNPTGKVLFVSGFPDKIRDYHSSRCRYLQKPYSISDLKAEMEMLQKNVAVGPDTL